MIWNIAKSASRIYEGLDNGWEHQYIKSLEIYITLLCLTSI